MPRSAPSITAKVVGLALTLPLSDADSVLETFKTILAHRRQRPTAGPHTEPYNGDGDAAPAPRKAKRARRGKKAKEADVPLPMGLDHGSDLPPQTTEADA